VRRPRLPTIPMRKDRKRPPGTSFDASDMSTDQLMAQLRTNTLVQYAQSLWDELYIASEFYLMNDWTIGVNVKPNFRHFNAWYQNIELPKHLSKNELYQGRLTFNTYTTLPGSIVEQAVNMIKEMATIRQAYAAIPWVDEYPDRALEILEICQDIKDPTSLRKYLVQHMPLPHHKPSEMSPEALGTDDGDVPFDEEALVEWLVMNPAPIVAGKICLPRCTGQGDGLETSYRLFIEQETKTFGADALWHEMRLAYLAAKPAEQREAAKTAIRKEWISVMTFKGRRRAKLPAWLAE
jgi:hypothetical protein